MTGYAFPWDLLSREYLEDNYPDSVSVINRLVADRDRLRQAALHVVLECRHGEVTDGSLALLAELVEEG